MEREYNFYEQEAHMKAMTVQGWPNELRGEIIHNREWIANQDGIYKLCLQIIFKMHV